MRLAVLFWALMLMALPCAAQYTRQDTLRGSNGRGRDWWDVLKYELEIGYEPHRIYGRNSITLKVVDVPNDSLQIDLDTGIALHGLRFPDDSSEVEPVRDGNVIWLIGNYSKLKIGDVVKLHLSFDGYPRPAVNPPWDGGLIWTRDSVGKPWIAVACQGLGASSWWPCKDYQGDEPDSGMTVFIANTSKQSMISNGQLFDHSEGEPLVYDANEHKPNRPYKEVIIPNSSLQLWTWEVKNPINSYNATIYIGDYAHYHDTLQGENGTLDLNFYPLKYNEAKARKHWAVTKDMLRCYEYWMGPYPFYEDGYKLVEAPYAGMEHQSAVAYGNEYKMGFRGWDRGGTGIGSLFDEIIIHESGHEWFGNSITAQDPADNWIHEGFATYTESLFVEWIMGRDSAFVFTKAQWANIRNDRPVIGDYGVNNEGSGDRYAKGAAVVHMVRMMLNDDRRFRELLRGLNRDFYHKIVTSRLVEEYIAKYVGLDLRAFFEIYLRATNKPRLEWCLKNGVLHYRWENVVPGFRAPVQLMVGDGNRYFTTDADWGSVKVGGMDVKVLAAGWYGVVEVEF